MTEQVRDHAQRARAISPAESFIVQAPAGSGKTELLIRRYLRLLATVDEPEEILAITFTLKAAAEMRGRVLSALEQARIGAEPADESARLTQELAAAALRRDGQRGWELAENPVRLRIQTIDALCARLTRQMPVLSRLGAQPETVEDARPHYLAAAAATLAELEEGNGWSDAIAVLLGYLDNDLPKIRDLIAELLARRDQWLAHVSSPDRRALEAALARLVESTLAAARAAIPGTAGAELAALLRYAAENSGASGQPRDLPPAHADDLPAWQAVAAFLLTGNGDWRKVATSKLGFPGKGSGPGAADRAAWKERYAALLASLSGEEILRRRLIEVRDLPPPRYADADWRVVEALCRLLTFADAQLTVQFAEHNRIDFTGITRAAIAALGADDAPTDLALNLDFAIRHVLVDEFQDISAQQYRLLERLTAGWTAGDARTLFLVGDPMQSIYGFREAEVGLFLDTWQRGRLGQVALAQLEITVNLRSSRGLVEWVNDTFRQILPAAPDPARGAVHHAPADPYHDGGADAAVTVHALHAGSAQEEGEAALVAEIVRAAAGPGRTVAVLVRNRPALEAIVPRLKREGLRFRAVEIESLGQRPAIQDLLALTRALCHAADHVAWFALLRAPWCGLTLDDLLALSGDRGPLTLWECLHAPDRLARLSAPGRAAAERVRAVLAGIFLERGRRRFRRWVESAWLRLGGPATVAGETDLDNVRACFDLLDELDAAGDPENVDQLTRHVAELYAAADTGAGDALQIMTIHKAKGLEFDVVIVPGLERLSRRDPPKLLRWAQRVGADGGRDLLLAPIRESGAETSPIYEFLKSLEDEKQAHEEARLLYVAATRARQHLHLVGAARMSEDGTPAAPHPRSLLSRLWPAVHGEFMRTFAGGVEDAGAGSPAVQTQRGLRRLPADWVMPEPEAAPARFPPPLVQAPPPGTDIEFEWAGRTIQHVGTAFHQCVRLLAGEPDPARARSLRRIHETLLRDLGVPAPELPAAADDVETALLNLIDDARGRWLLDPAHAEAREEYSLSGLHQGQLVSVVLDRTFVAEDGTRWIVDYKTSRHEGPDLDAFLDREQSRYREQLERYAALMRGMDERPIRLGLYFPLLRGWREWAPEHAGTAG